MKRFNLLLMSPDASLTQAAFKGLSKVYKSNFVFEATTLEEGLRLLGKLQIDLLLVDAAMGADLSQLSRRQPNAIVMCIASAGPTAAAVGFRTLAKHDLAASLAAELKSLRKSGEIATRTSAMPSASTPDFKDFSRLSSSDLALS